jgi:oxygen-independent coproporphyrinogen-3 oxidase
MSALRSTNESPAPGSWLHDGELIAKYDGRAPRYTSYPTAAQFGPRVDAGAYRQWLAELPVGEAVSLYVHIPFCQRLCWYCGCNTRAVTRRQTISDYVGYLRTEAALLEAALPGRLRVRHLHLGGGTPNMLGRDDLTDLFQTLRHVFQISGEIAAELDPAVLSKEWVRAAAFHGLTRASLGVQDLSEEVQQAINRVESFEVLKNAAGWLREAGVRSINFDLMYGLPRQTTASLLQTIDKILTLRPDRIALFGYAHVPWMKPHQELIDTAALPAPIERMAQSRAAAERLEYAGYVSVGLDHYALPADELAHSRHSERLHRNFQGYTVDDARTLIGLGASAIGHLPQGYVQNQSTEMGWRRALDAGELPVARGLALTDEDRFRADIIERLMCDMGVDLEAACARHGRDLRAVASERLAMEDFVADGLVTDHDGLIVVSERGRPFVRAICALFDTHFHAGEGRHARLV